MLQTGAFHTLTVISIDASGATLGDDAFLLPSNEVPEDLSVGDQLHVFVSVDNREQLVATTARPALTFGEFAVLCVVDQNEYGAFLDWGLKKDLFVPSKEQPYTLSIGQKHCVTLTRDAQGRVMGSARVEEFLDRDLSPLQTGKAVRLLVYEFHDLGAKVIADGRYGGMVYADDIYQELELGTELNGFIEGMREDGKLDIRLRSRGTAALTEGKESLLSALVDADGFLPLHDKSSPEDIYDRLQMSKKAFKRSVGILMKAGRLSIEQGGIRLKQQE